MRTKVFKTYKKVYYNFIPEETVWHAALSNKSRPFKFYKNSITSMGLVNLKNKAKTKRLTSSWYFLGVAVGFNHQMT